MTALALHTAHALNATHDSLSLLNEEVHRLWKVAIENHMALKMFTALQSGVCVRVGAECCVYIPYVHHNVSQALWPLASETHDIEHITGDL